MNTDIERLTKHYEAFINPYWSEIVSQMELPASFTRAKGSFLIDENGEEWLDLVAGYGSVNLGHNNEEIKERVIEHLQSDYPSIFPWGRNLHTAKLSERLSFDCPIKSPRMVFSCSGAEAIETALKLTLSHTKRTRFMSFSGGFHGLSLTATSLNGHPMWTSTLPYSGENQNVRCVSGLAECTQLLRTETFAAVVLEIVQAIGGGYVWDEQELINVANVCKETQTCLIIDEVQTGVGRVGSMYASSRLPADLPPDIIVLAKGLTGGAVPLSVTICREDIHHSLFGQAGTSKIHGSTYAGYSTAVAFALATLDCYEKNNIEEYVSVISDLLRSRLADIKKSSGCIHSIEGDGLLVTIVFHKRYEDLVGFCLQNFFANRILVNLSSHRPNTLKITPPLNIEEKHLEHFCDVLEAILSAYQS